MTSAIVKQSCTSATSIFLKGSSKPDIEYAFLAASRADSRPVNSFLLLRFAVPEATPIPLTQIGSCLTFFANRSLAKITHDDPSVMGEQSSNFSGHATYLEDITSSTLTSFWNCAFGLREP